MFKVASLFAVSAFAGLASANIVVNGSFEEPNITSGFVAYAHGSTAIAGWTVFAPSPGLGVDIVSAVGFADSRWAFDGVQSVELAGTPGRGGVEQALTTVPGAQYTLSFSLSSQPSSPVVDGVSVFWDGALVATLTSPGFGTWQTFSFDVTAGRGPTTLLAFSGNVDGFLGTLVDDVSVVIPAPGAAAIVMSGLAAPGIMGRRRRR